MKFNLEDKIFLTLIVLISCLGVIVLGGFMIKFMPMIFKFVGVIANIASVWFFIKYIRKTFFKKEVKKSSE